MATLWSRGSGVCLFPFGWRRVRAGSDSNHWKNHEQKRLELRAEFFNLFNHGNFENPIANLNVISQSGGSIDANTGRIINPGDFGRIVATSSNPRLIQFAIRLDF